MGAGMYDILVWPGEAPQDWPPGPIIPANDTFTGPQTFKITSNTSTVISVTQDVGTPTPIGNQQNTSAPSETPPPCNPSNLPGSPQCIGPVGPVIVPPTYTWPF